MLLEGTIIERVWQWNVQRLQNKTGIYLKYYQVLTCEPSPPTIALGIICSGEDVLDSQPCAHASPKWRSELGDSVRHERPCHTSYATHVTHHTPPKWRWRRPHTFWPPWTSWELPSPIVLTCQWQAAGTHNPLKKRVEAPQCPHADTKICSLELGWHGHVGTAGNHGTLLPHLCSHPSRWTCAWWHVYQEGTHCGWPGTHTAGLSTSDALATSHSRLASSTWTVLTAREEVLLACRVLGPAICYLRINHNAKIFLTRPSVWSCERHGCHPLKKIPAEQ